MDYLAFQVSGEDFAVSLLRVQEVSILGPLTRLPGAAPAIRGVLNLRGSVIPVVDLAVRLGRSRTRISRRTGLVCVTALVEGRLDVVGLMVDALAGILCFAPEDVLAPPPGLFAPERDILVGLGSVEGRLVPLLEVDVLVDPSRLRAVLAAPAPREEPASRIADAAQGSTSAAADGASPAGPIPTSTDAGPLPTSAVAPRVSIRPPRPDAGPPRTSSAPTPAATPHRISAPIPAPAAPRPPALVLHSRPESRPAQARAVLARAGRIPPTWPPPEPPARTPLAPPPPLPSPDLRPTDVALPDAAVPDRAGPDRAHPIPPLPEPPRGRAAWVMGLAATGAALLLLLAIPSLEDRRSDAQPREKPTAPQAAVQATVAVPAPVPATVQVAPSRPESRIPSPSSPVPLDDRAAAARGETLPRPEAIHEVRRGDTLWALSRRYCGNPFLWPRIFTMNRDLLENPHLISPGERLRIPPRC